VHAALALALGDVLTVLHHAGFDEPAAISDSNAGALHPRAGSSSVLADRSTTATIRAGRDHSIVHDDAEVTDLMAVIKSGSDFESIPGQLFVALPCHSNVLQGKPSLGFCMMHVFVCCNWFKVMPVTEAIAGCEPTFCTRLSFEFFPMSCRTASIAVL
jgi:hypothetical protein